jgi:hypothetical protein
MRPYDRWGTRHLLSGRANCPADLFVAGDPVRLHSPANNPAGAELRRWRTVTQLCAPRGFRRRICLDIIVRQEAVCLHFAVRGWLG